MAQFLKEMLSSVGPSRARGRDTKMLREILDQTALRVGQELKGQPVIECELRRILGRTYNDLGEYTNALAMAQEALRLSRSLFGEAFWAVADAATELGAFQVNMGDWPGAEASHKQALAIRRRLRGEEHADVAQSVLNVGIVKPTSLMRWRWQKGWAGKSILT